MANPITTTATTLEAQLIEVVNALVAAELAIAEEARPDNVQLSPDIDSSTINVTATIPATFTAGSAGQIELNASTYLA